MSLDLSCPDWVERLKTGRSLVPALRLPNPEEGERAVQVFNRLRLFDVPGTPTMAEAAGDWFRDIVRALFGSIDPVTKARLIRELFLLVPKKQNKTTGGALLMLTALLLNERPRAPFLLTGPVQKTADDAFAAAEGAIALDPVLSKKLHVRDHLKTIIHRETQAKLEIMTFDPDVVTGKKVVGALVDEEHVLGKMPRAKKAMVQLRGGMLPFPEAFLAIITTQSDEAPAGVFDEDLTRAREIRDGKRSGQMLPILYEFPREMQEDPAKPWKDPACWPMVTPNLGRSIALDSLVNAFRDEEANGEAALRVWASQHLNIQIGVALHSKRWTGADFWEAATRVATLEELIELSDILALGIDGGGLDDLLGACVIGRHAETGVWMVWAKAWAHPIVLERRKSEASRLKDLEKAGELMLVDLGKDMADLADLARLLDRSGKLAGVGVDPAGITEIEKMLRNECGIDEGDDGDDRIVGVRQGWTLTSIIKTCERKLADGSLVHCGQALMAWAVGNAKVEPRGNAVLITKAASGTGKIDPLMAMFCAAEVMARAPELNVCSDPEVLVA